MSFFSALFSAPEQIQKITDAAIHTGDALVYTDEERARASDKRLDWLLKYLDATSGSALARRLLALAVTVVFLLLALVTTVAEFTAPSHVEGLLKILDAYHLWELVFGVWAFYFAHRLLPDIFKGAK